MTRCALGLDLGTSGLKGVLLDETGAVLATAESSYAFDSPHPGWAEIDPGVWERAARTVVARLLADAQNARIVSLAIDGQMHGAVLVDTRGEAVRPAMLWPDTRAVAELDAWRSAPPAAVRALANPVAPGMAGPMLAWVASHEPEVFSRAALSLSPKDWLRSRLVPDSLVTDPSDASATLLWDVPADDWNHAIAAPFAHLLPAVLPSTTVAGRLGAGPAADWGLPAGLPVAVGSGDVAATLRGMDARPGVLSVILGSGAQALLTRIAPEATAAPAFHTFRASDASSFAMAAPMNGGIALQRVRELLDLGWAELYGALEHRVEASDPLFLPFFTGERLPRALAGGQAGWTGLGLATTPGVLAATAVEGMLFGLRLATAALPASTGPVDLVGGGSRHPLVQQLVADVLGRPIERRTLENATAIGAALLAWEAAGVAVLPRRDFSVTRSEPRAGRVLDERYSRFVAAVADLRSA